ncbi:MAG: hypothetical protein ACE5KM_00510 [Planctomycetaceae bacterium]
MNVELTNAEQTVLLETLRDRLGTLREQIHHATISTFTEELKAKKELLNELIRKLESQVGSAVRTVV